MGIGWLGPHWTWSSVIFCTHQLQVLCPGKVILYTFSNLSEKFDLAWQKPGEYHSPHWTWSFVIFCTHQLQVLCNGKVIFYTFSNLSENYDLAWQKPGEYQLWKNICNIFSNFIKTGLSQQDFADQMHFLSLNELYFWSFGPLISALFWFKELWIMIQE